METEQIKISAVEGKDHPFQDADLIAECHIHVSLRHSGQHSSRNRIIVRDHLCLAQERAARAGLFQELQAARKYFEEYIHVFVSEEPFAPPRAPQGQGQGIAPTAPGCKFAPANASPSDRPPPRASGQTPSHQMKPQLNIKTPVPDRCTHQIL